MNTSDHALNIMVKDMLSTELDLKSTQNNSLIYKRILHLSQQSQSLEIWLQRISAFSLDQSYWETEME